MPCGQCPLDGIRYAVTAVASSQSWTSSIGARNYDLLHSVNRKNAYEGYAAYMVSLSCPETGPFFFEPIFDTVYATRRVYNTIATLAFESLQESSNIKSSRPGIPLFPFSS